MRTFWHTFWICASHDRRDSILSSNRIRPSTCEFQKRKCWIDISIFKHKCWNIMSALEGEVPFPQDAKRDFILCNDDTLEQLACTKSLCNDDTLEQLACTKSLCNDEALEQLACTKSLCSDDILQQLACTKSLCNDDTLKQLACTNTSSRKNVAKPGREGVRSTEEAHSRPCAS
jgi:hypothetical protein